MARRTSGMSVSGGRTERTMNRIGLTATKRAREVDLRDRRLAQAVVAHVADDADDLHAGAVGTAEAAVGAESVLTRPVRPDRGLVDDDSQQVLAHVPFVEEAAALKRELDRRQILRADRVKADALHRLGTGRPALRVERGAEAAAGKRSLARQAPRSVTPGIASSADVNRFWNWSRSAVSLLGSATVSLERQQVIGIEARRHPAQVDQVRDEDPARREQREGERDLGDDERLREASRPRARRGADAVAQHVGRRGPHRLPERREAGEHARQRARRHRQRAAPSSRARFRRRAGCTPPPATPRFEPAPR